MSTFLLVVACKVNPFTGEKNLNFVSNSQIFPAAFEQYDQVLAESNVVTGTAESRMLVEVGNKIATAAKRFLDANGYQGYLEGYAWEFKLIKDDETVNAWAMICCVDSLLPPAAALTATAPSCCSWAALIRWAP